MITRVDQFIEKFVLDNMYKESVDDRCICEFLDRIRTELELDCVYVMQNVNGKYNFRFTNMSVSEEKYDATGRYYTMTDREYQQFLININRSKQKVSEQTVPTPNGISKILMVSFCDRNNYYGSIGFQQMKEYKWTEEERVAVVKVAHILQCFIYGKSMTLPSAYENSMNQFGFNLFWYYPQIGTMCFSEQSQKKFHLEAKYENMPESFIEEFVAPAYYDVFREMYEKIQSGERTASCVYKLNQYDMWLHMCLSATQWDEKGTVGECIGFVEDVSQGLLQEKVQHEKMEQAKEAQAQANRELALHRKIERKLSSMYLCIYYLDLNADTYICVYGEEQIRNHIADEGKSTENMKKATEVFTSKEFYDSISKFNDLGTVKERMRDQEVLTCDYQGFTGRWCRSTFVAMDRDMNGDVKNVLYAIQRIVEGIRRPDYQSYKRRGQNKACTSLLQGFFR